MNKKLLYLLIFTMPFLLLGQVDDNDPPSSWEFDIAPQLWLASLKGNIGYLDASIPVEARFRDLVDQLSFGAMLHAEARKGRWAIMTDLVYMKLEETGSVTRLDIPAEAEVKQLIWELGGAYSIWQFDDFLDISGIAGMRVFSLDPRLNVGDIIVVDEDVSFIDPYFGVRFRTNSERWVTSARFDFGGLGIGSEFSWKTNLFVGYKFSKLLTYYLGIQGYNVDYEGDNGFTYDMFTGGFMTGLNFHF